MTNTPTPIPTDVAIDAIRDANSDPECDGLVYVDYAMVVCNAVAHLRSIIARIHEAIGESAGSDDDSLPDVVRQIVTEHRERVDEQDALLREQAETIAALEKLRVHCDKCGGDYAQTGVEVGCPCEQIAILTRRLHYVEKEGWDCQTKLKASVAAACDALGVPHHEHHRIVEKITALTKERDELRKAAPSLIESRDVVSPPDAAVLVTEINLSKAAADGLVTRGEIPGTQEPEPTPTKRVVFQFDERSM